MDRNELIEFLKDCVAQIYKADANSLSENTNLPQEFGTNSLQRVGLCSLIENDTDILISVGDIGKYPTIGNLADYILKNM